MCEMSGDKPSTFPISVFREYISESTSALVMASSYILMMSFPLETKGTSPRLILE